MQLNSISNFSFINPYDTCSNGGSSGKSLRISRIADGLAIILFEA
jgi:hypothetical protein